jgi:RecB family exonuclease
MDNQSQTALWQQRIIDSWQPGTLILTSGGRLARQLQHLYRVQNMAAGIDSWRPLEVSNLNRWLHDCAQDLWETETPAGLWLRLRLWHEIVHNNQPPADLPLDLALCQTLDQTYGVLIRHRLDPTATDYPSPLVSWRQQMCGQFISALRDVNRYHPSELPLKISNAIEAELLIPPDSLMLAAFEAPAPIEQDLFRLLQQKTTATVFALPRQQVSNIHAVSLPNEEEEILYLAHSLVHSSQRLRPATIGVVVPNLGSYAPPLRKTLQRMLGQPSSPAEETYNITLGTPLLEHPLVQAALLPLRLLGDEEKRVILLSLLLSPYYGLWAQNRYHLARLDRSWREMHPQASLNSLFSEAYNKRPEVHQYLAAKGNVLLHVLADFQQSRSLPVSGWEKLVASLWDSLDFPILADESDRIAYNHLTSTVSDLVADLGSWVTDCRTFLNWLRQALATEIFQVGASEQAGVQLMGLIESRGLSFQRLFLLGMTSTALPQPVRPFPFLDIEERSRILGATMRSQYEFAHGAFQNLLAAAPEIILTKPEKVGDEPVSATPFYSAPWQSIQMDIWHNPDAACSRITWLRSAWKSFNKQNSEEPAEHLLSAPLPFPESLSVSSLAVAFQCPFRFLIQELLGLKPLTEPASGIRPEDRGRRIHQVLACITRNLRAQQSGAHLNRECVLSTVRRCVADVHAAVDAIPIWQVERRRWLGKQNGLLTQWFQEELSHLQSGWRWLAEEIPFTGLAVEGWPTHLTGRIDRLDFHSEAGLLCWDYKSGSSPSSFAVFSHFSEPQLPAYLLALLQGLVAIPGHSRLRGYPLQAGYISLKSEKDIKLDTLCADADTWQDFIPIWKERLVELGKQLMEGRFPADPVPDAPVRERERLCSSCGLRTICNRKSFA